jgi:hypothetical protein
VDRQEGIELTSRQAASLILRDFPGFQISTIDKLGEGLGNVAFEVNCS